MDFSSLTSTALAEPTTVDYFTFTTGVKAESIKQENASYAADEVTFEKQVSLTTGKVAVADGVALDEFDTLATENNSVAKHVFTLTAGTYHLGGSGGGAYVYDLLVSLA